jgi:thymidylate synthase (FAD)
MAEIILRSEIGVEEIQYVGDDATLAHAAMVSTKGMLADQMPEGKVPGLLNFLMKNRHGTPFEHGSLTVRVHAPIKVWREWHRHRIGWSYNEESGRYKQLEPVFWLPPPHRPMMRPEGFRSALPSFDLATPEEYALLTSELKEGYQLEYDRYERLLAAGFDRGLARDVLGVGIFSACYCTANPRSIMAFLELRTKVDESKRPSKPLWEINDAASQLEAIFASRWPITHKCWNENGRMAP